MQIRDYLYKGKKIMMSHKLFSFLMIIAIEVCIYTYNFRGKDISTDSSDWGAFADYMGLSLGIISILLIYITYEEQRKTNKISLSESNYNTKIKTLNDLLIIKGETLSAGFALFKNHFKTDTYHSENKKELVEDVLREYYSDITYNYEQMFDNIFRYLRLTINGVLCDNAISDEAKFGRVKELSCIVPDSVRTLFLCWLLRKNDKSRLNAYYLNGFFDVDSYGFKLLPRVIAFVCTGILPLRQKEDGNNARTGYDERPNETFQETYNRISKSKQK